MDDAKRRLDVLTVTAPCPESWAEMEGDDEVRFCGLCRMNVYDLSALTRERAERLVAEREGRLCVRFYRRADGTISTIDCEPARLRALRQAARKTLTVAATLVASLFGLMVGLGALRLEGLDLVRWFERGPLGSLAGRTMGEAPLMDPSEMGEPMFDEPVFDEPMIDPAPEPGAPTVDAPAW